MRVLTTTFLVCICFAIQSCSGGSGDQQQIDTGNGNPPTDNVPSPDENPELGEGNPDPDPDPDPDNSDSPVVGGEPPEQSPPNIPPNPIGNDTSSGLLDVDKELSWSSDQQISGAALSEKIQQRRSEGQMLIDIDAYIKGGDTTYSMVWRENLHGREWVESHGVSEDIFLDTNETHSANGYRPVDIEIYAEGEQQAWAGIWVKNDENLQWSMHHSVPGSNINTHLQQNQDAGFRLVDIEYHPASDSNTFTTLWYQNSTDLIWEYELGMTYEQYTQQVETQQARGLKVVDVESYSADQVQLYSVIWQSLTDFTWQTAVDRTEQQFTNLYHQYKDEGYRLIDLERHGSETEPRFSGIWAENSPRLRSSQDDEIDNIVSDYAQANNLPGISVAVIRSGTMIYRKGTGFADKEVGKLAHGETVYNVASIAKAIGGTLAAKFESEGRLRNGFTFNLDLSQPTASFLQNIPSADGSGTVSLPGHHQHSVEELLAHLGCIPHYNTQPNIANSTEHFPNASDAVQSIWDTPLVTETTDGQPCSPSFTYSYSTGAFTFVGAALEVVTERTINQLIAEELSIPYDLTSLRTQFASTTLVPDDNRATPYDNSNIPTNYSDNSWKVLGGGMEASAVDLARFGWYVLDGKIVDANTRDNRLWSKVNSQQSNFGLGWVVSDTRAEMNGSWTGARGILRVYRNDGVVIAVLSNRTNHSVDDVSCLAEKIRNSIFNVNTSC